MRGQDQVLAALSRDPAYCLAVAPEGVGASKAFTAAVTVVRDISHCAAVSFRPVPPQPHSQRTPAALVERVDWQCSGVDLPHA
jgi:hypothetical protein